MTIIVFLIDTSASMQQATFVAGRTTLLNMAKTAVETFVKARQKFPDSRGDRYMLFNFEEYPKNIKAGWKENLPAFNNELKNLEANGMTTFGYALRQVFDTLNVNRLQNGMDMYGLGRYPNYLEPAVIIAITDGGKLTSSEGVELELNLPASNFLPGSELTREPFRWDQRLYALVLRMAGTPPMQHEGGHVASDCSPIDSMCEITGGRSYAVTSPRILYQCIESLVQKLQSGVVVHFEKVGADPVVLMPHKENENKVDDGLSLSRTDTSDTVVLDEDAALFSIKGQLLKDHVKETHEITKNSYPSRPPTPNPILSSNNVSWHYTKRLILVPRSSPKGFNVGYWPLPESFCPDIAAASLPQRSTHPIIKFTCIDQEPTLIDNLPFDKYELEPSPLTLYILARKQPKTCWQVYVQGSSKTGLTNNHTENIGFPFGYLKASTNLLTVNLYVLPYNYPLLLPLLNDLFKIHRLKPTTEWRLGFEGYLKNIPPYYAGPLRRALVKMGAGNLASSLIPEALDTFLSFNVSNYLKQIKTQAKLEYDRIINPASTAKCRNGPEGIKVIPRSSVKKALLRNQMHKDKFLHLQEQINDFSSFTLGINKSGNGKNTRSTNNQFRNPFDIPRKNLLDQIIRMRANFLQACANQTKLIDDDSRHNLPVGQMGNYQDHVKKMPVPLREIESTPIRQHMFGNPFKTNKNVLMGEVDEVSFSSPGSNTFATNRGQKRQIDTTSSNLGIKRGKKGPLPRDFVYHRPLIQQLASESNVQVTGPENSSRLEEDERQYEPSTLERQPEMSNMITFNDLSQSLDNNDNLIESKSKNKENSQSILQVGSSSYNETNITRSELKGECLLTTEATVNLKQGSPTTLGNSEQTCIPSLANSSANVSSINDMLTDNASSSTLSAPKVSVNKSYNISRPMENLDHTSKFVISNMINTSGISEHSSVKHPQKVISSPNNTGIYTKDEIRRIHQRNLNIRQMIYKEVKRPGKNHDTLFKMLKEEIHGPPNIRKQYIQDVINEALRFKRNNLADLLQKFMDQMTPNPLPQ